MIGAPGAKAVNVLMAKRFSGYNFTFFAPAPVI
jgi:hypothetical protein